MERTKYSGAVQSVACCAVATVLLCTLGVGTVQAFQPEPVKSSTTIIVLTDAQMAAVHGGQDPASFTCGAYAVLAIVLAWEVGWPAFICSAEWATAQAAQIGLSGFWNQSLSEFENTVAGVLEASEAAEIDVEGYCPNGFSSNGGCYSGTPDFSVTIVGCISDSCDGGDVTDYPSGCTISYCNMWDWGYCDPECCFCDWGG